MNAAVLGWAERRRFARVSLDDATRGMTLCPSGRSGPVARVLDFSPGGVSIAPDSGVFSASSEEPLSLRILDREIPCSLAPESSERFAAREEGKADRVGVPLYFDGAAHDEVARAYHQLRFPALSRRGSVPAHEVRRLFADSGYLSLRPGLEPDGAWVDAQWPSSLSHEAVFRERSGRAIGHIAITRAYKNAWLGHEIATLRESPEAMQCRRDLYQHFCVWPRLLDGEGTHVFGYYNPQRRFHQQMFEGFASQSSTEDCAIVRMDRYMPWVEGTRAREFAASGGLVVRPMTPADEIEVLPLIRRYWPVLATTAFDIAPGELRRTILHPAFDSVGVERGRECLVIMADGAIAGVVLCEWDDTRLSLFDVLSVAHVFLAPDVKPNAEIQACVSTVVQQFYRARDLRVPLLTCPPGTFQRRDLPGFKWAETMGCIVFSARALRAFETYVEVTLDAETRSDAEGRPVALGK